MLLYHFCFVLFCIWGQFPSTSLQGLIIIRRGDLTEGFWCYDLGAYIWRGLFSEYYGMLSFKEYEILSSTTMQVFSYININLLIFFMPNLKIDFIRQWNILVRPYWMITWMSLFSMKASPGTLWTYDILHSIGIIRVVIKGLGTEISAGYYVHHPWLLSWKMEEI